MATATGTSAALNRRATVLLVVLVVVAISAMIGASSLSLSDAQAGSASRSLRAAQARAAAWSGVQAVMAQLHGKRDSLLRGEVPRIATGGSIGRASAAEGRGRLVYRVVGGGRLVSESARLDVNTATADILAKVPGLNESTARAIVAARGDGPFTSLLDLLRVPGITAEMVLGRGATAAAESQPSSAEVRNADGEGEGLSAWLTVFSFDPNVQAGAGTPGGREWTGQPRLLPTKDSEAFERAVRRRLPAEAAEALLARVAAGSRIGSSAELLNVLGTLPPAHTAGLLDAITFTDDTYLIGRVDLNLAPTEVLACLPGLDLARAESIVARRARLDDASRSTPYWPVLEGVLTPDEFRGLADWVTCRSLQWRVWVEAGWLPTPGAGGDASDPDGIEPLDDRVALEAVVDIAGARPRIAYLRDVTRLDVARRLRSTLAGKVAPPGDTAPTESKPGDPLQTPEVSLTPAGPADYRPSRPTRADQVGAPEPGGGGESQRGQGRGRVGRWRA